MVFIDSNVILDIWDNDPAWAHWSRSQVNRLKLVEELIINSVVYAELAPQFNSRDKLDKALEEFEFMLFSIPREAAFLAGRAFLQYRRRSGTKTGVLPDFLIGAHAAVLGADILTRDIKRYSTYFPTVRLITP